jgi:hypothetical protein
MNIHEIGEKIKSWDGLGRVVGAFTALLLGIVAFGLGRLSVLPQDTNKPYVKIVTPSGELLTCPKSE